MTTNSRAVFATGAVAGLVLMVIGVALRVAASREHQRCLTQDVREIIGPEPASVLISCDDPSATGMVVAVVGALICVGVVVGFALVRRV
ncbi:hypothetical protein [Williamsia sp. M5A3_1d]